MVRPGWAADKPNPQGRIRPWFAIRLIKASAFIATENLDFYPHLGHRAVARAHGKGIDNNLAIPGGNERGTGEIVLQVRGRRLSPIRFKVG